MKKYIVYLNIIRFLPHWLCYKLSKRRYLIDIDLDAYKKEYKLNKSNNHALFHLLFFNRSFRSLFYYRLGNIKWLISWLAKGIENLKITDGIFVGGGLLFFHAYGTTLNAEKIGNNCRILHNVTLGDKKGGRPTIGNRVEILPNAVIVGNITIGDDCVIGPGAVVYKSIPNNCVVVGNPAIILKENNVVVRKPI